MREHAAPPTSALSFGDYHASTRASEDEQHRLLELHAACERLAACEDAFLLAFQARLRARQHQSWSAEPLAVGTLAEWLRLTLAFLQSPAQDGGSIAAASVLARWMAHQHISFSDLTRTTDALHWTMCDILLDAYADGARRAFADRMTLLAHVVQRIAG